MSIVLDFEHSIEGVCDSSTLAAPQIPNVSTVLHFEQSIQHSIEGMCDSSTLGALQIPKVSIVLHFQHLNLTGDVVGGPGGRSRSVPALIFPEDVVGWGAAHPMSRAKSDNSSTL